MLARGVNDRPYNLTADMFSLENRHNRTVIGAVDVILDLVAGQGSVQRLNGGVVLAAFLHNQYVGVGLGSSEEASSVARASLPTEKPASIA